MIHRINVSSETLRPTLLHVEIGYPEAGTGRTARDYDPRRSARGWAQIQMLPLNLMIYSPSSLHGVTLPYHILRSFGVPGYATASHTPQKMALKIGRPSPGRQNPAAPYPPFCTFSAPKHALASYAVEAIAESLFNRPTPGIGVTVDN
jgi:hypothetical protein